MFWFAKFRHKGQFYLGALHMLDKLCVFHMGFAHVLACLTHVSEHVQVYLGFVHIVDSLCNFALVFTRLTMAFHIFGNMSFYMGVVHMIDNMCNFAPVFAHGVPLLVRLSDDM